MKIGLYETLILLDRLGYRCVDIKPLLRTFFEHEEPPAEAPALPPETGEKVYKTIEEAKKAAKKGENPVFDGKIGGYVNIK